MKIAILIHVHQDPQQLVRLVDRLLHPDVDIYVNVDAKANTADFRSVLDNRVHFIKNSIEVTWGRFSQVQQILNSFQEIRDSKIEYSHILFISGQDYPLQSIDQIIQFLGENKDKSFIDYHLVSKDKNDEWRNVIHRRFEYWYFLPSNDIRANGFVRKLYKLVGYKRKYPTDDIYYGACWFTLTSDAVDYLLDYIQSNPSVIKFFQHTGCADELFFQSILLNSPLRDQMVNNHYRYIDWEKGGNRPKDLTVSDYDRIKESDAWFARKINPQIDNSLADLLDELARSK